MLTLPNLSVRKLTRPIRPSTAGRRPLRLESLEPRDVPATAIVAIGADSGGPRVTVYDRTTSAVVLDFFAFDPSFTGGVRVATGDLTGDGTPDVLAASGPGISPLIKLYDGKLGGVVRTLNPFDSGFLGGVSVAVGDVTGDTVPDIVAGADAGGGPRVQVFDGKSGAILRDFFAFDPSFSGGVRVAAGDLNGDSRVDLIAGAGPGGGPAVNTFDGTTGSTLGAFFAYDPAFTGGVTVAAADLTGDAKTEIVAGAGAGGGPAVRVFDGASRTPLSAFFAYDPSFTGGVRVAAFSAGAFGKPDILVAPGPGASLPIRVFDAPGGVATTTFETFGSGFSGGAFVAGSSFAATVGGEIGDPPPVTVGPALITLQLKPLDINLLGLTVQSSPITVTVSVDTGSGLLLGNLLTVVSNLVNLQGVNSALNNVLGNVVDLLNGATLSVTNAVTNTGPLSTPSIVATTPVLDLFVAPVHLNLLGAKVDTSPISLKIAAQSGDGLVLGNVLTDLANLFNPPLPDRLDLDFINSRLQNLLTQLEAQLPGIPPAPITNPPPITNTGQVLRLTVPPIDLNLLGLLLQTQQIQVNADAQTGNGELLGNVLQTLLNTLGATPDNLNALSNNLNNLLAKVVGVLNASSLALAPGAVGGLSQVLQTLALADLINTTGAPAQAPILTLSIASTDGTSPPVDVDLLGLKITTSNIDAKLTAVTGEGQILGNLVYNVAHLLDPGGTLNLLAILNQLDL